MYPNSFLIFLKLPKINKYIKEYKQNQQNDQKNLVIFSGSNHPSFFSDIQQS